MLALIITGSILLLILLLLSMTITAVVDYKKEAQIKVKILFFDLLKEKKVKKRKTRIKNKVNKIQSRSNPRQSNYSKPDKPIIDIETPQLPAKKPKEIKKDIPDIDFALIKLIYLSLAQPFKRLISKVRITELKYESIVGGSDAAMTAISFGLHNAAVYGALAWLKTISNVKTERINIEADFMREESDFTLHCKIRVRAGTVLLCVLAFMMKAAKIKAYENGNGHSNGNGKHAPQPRKANLGKSIRIIMD